MKTWQHIATCYKGTNPDKQANVWLLKMRKILTERPGRMAEDGDSLVVYKSSQLRIWMATSLEILIV